MRADRQGLLRTRGAVVRVCLMVLGILLQGSRVLTLEADSNIKGVWLAELEGKPSIILFLTVDRDRLSGTIIEGKLIQELVKGRLEGATLLFDSLHDEGKATWSGIFVSEELHCIRSINANGEMQWERLRFKKLEWRSSTLGAMASVRQGLDPCARSYLSKLLPLSKELRPLARGEKFLLADRHPSCRDAVALPEKMLGRLAAGLCFGVA